MFAVRRINLRFDGLLLHTHELAIITNFQVARNVIVPVVEFPDLLPEVNVRLRFDSCQFLNEGSHLEPKLQAYTHHSAAQQRILLSNGNNVKSQWAQQRQQSEIKL
jgi:hypothetical protein